VNKVVNHCPHCGTKNADDANFCNNCGTKLRGTQGEPANQKLTTEQLRQVQLESIWVEEKKVPKWLRGTWQAKLSFKQLEKGLTESEKQYLKRRRDTE
jgi:methionyl-tRNA synthetase